MRWFIHEYLLSRIYRTAPISHSHIISTPLYLTLNPFDCVSLPSLLRQFHQAQGAILPSRTSQESHFEAGFFTCFFFPCSFRSSISIISIHIQVSAGLRIYTELPLKLELPFHVSLPGYVS